MFATSRSSNIRAVSIDCEGERELAQVFGGCEPEEVLASPLIVTGRVVAILLGASATVVPLAETVAPVESCLREAGRTLEGQQAGP